MILCQYFKIEDQEKTPDSILFILFIFSSFKLLTFI